MKHDTKTCEFLYGIREMVSFELGREIEKDVFSSCHERGTMKKFWVPWGIEPQIFAFRAPMLYHWATEHSTVSEVYYEVHKTHFLHTARISDIDSVMFVNSIRFYLLIIFTNMTLYILDLKLKSLYIKSYRQPPLGGKRVQPSRNSELLIFWKNKTSSLLRD